MDARATATTERLSRRANGSMVRPATPRPGLPAPAEAPPRCALRDGDHHSLVRVDYVSTNRRWRRETVVSTPTRPPTETGRATWPSRRRHASRVAIRGRPHRPPPSLRDPGSPRRRSAAGTRRVVRRGAPTSGRCFICTTHAADRAAVGRPDRSSRQHPELTVQRVDDSANTGKPSIPNSMHNLIDGPWPTLPRVSTTRKAGWATSRERGPLTNGHLRSRLKEPVSVTAECEGQGANRLGPTNGTGTPGRVRCHVPRRRLDNDHRASVMSLVPSAPFSRR